MSFQFRITGPGGGDWQVIVKDGKCEAKAGEHASPTTTILMSDEDFLQLIGGKLNAMQAYTSGKLKIQGDLMKSQLIEKLFKLSDPDRRANHDRHYFLRWVYSSTAAGSHERIPEHGLVCSCNHHGGTG